MNWPILLGILGIAAPLLIKFAEKRLYWNSQQYIRQTVVRELLESISEDNIPNREIISAIIRSVLCDYKVKKLDILTADEIIDDLIRDITFNPFLSSKRRRQIQDELLALRSTRKNNSQEGNAP